MDADRAGFIERLQVRVIETALGSDRQRHVRPGARRRGQDGNRVAARHAGEDPCRARQRRQRLGQGDRLQHRRRRRTSGQLGRLACDGTPPVETPYRALRIEARHRASGEDGADRRRTRDHERRDGGVHLVGGDRLEHMDRQPRLARHRPAPGDGAGNARRAHDVEHDAVLDEAALDHDDRLPGARSQRACEVLRVAAGQGRPSVLDVSSVDEEARHGPIHGAARAASYGGAMTLGRLTAHTADGVALAVVVAGDGVPLLLIPGLGAGRSVFEPILGHLVTRHRVITYDPRGIGESGHGGHVTMASMALDAVAVLDAAGVEAGAVFGASMGGLIAQHLVVDHPARVASLMLAATAPGGDDGVDADPASQTALLGKGARTPEDAYRLACTVLYSEHFLRTHVDFIEAQIRERGRHPVRPRVFSAQMKAMYEPDGSFARLRAVDVPTLVLHGTADVITPFENARILAGQIPGAVLRPFDECGHLFFHERPAETARVMSEHLRSFDSGARQPSSKDDGSSPFESSSIAGS